MVVLRSLLVAMMATMTFCQETPEWFQDKESELLRALMAAKDLKWNQKEENGVKQIIEDIRANRDPETESEVIRMELAYAFRNLKSLNPYREEKVKSWFRQFLGDTLANEVFAESEKIMEEELRKKSYVQKHLDFNHRQKYAWKHAVSDAERNRDMTKHNQSILKRISADASKIYALPEADQEAEKAMLVISHGQHTADNILNGIHAVHDEVKGKAHAKSQAEKAMKQVLAGTYQEANPAQVSEAAAAKPAQVQDADAEPADAQDADAKRTQEDTEDTKPAQAQASGAKPAEAQAAAATPVQVQAAAAKRTQEDAVGAQAQASDANPAQVQASGAKPAQVQAADANPAQVQAAVAKPAQVQASGAKLADAQAAGAKRTQEDAASAKRTQGQAAGSNPAQVQAEDSKSADRAQSNVAKPVRGKVAKGKPPQVQAAGATPTPGQAA